MKHDSLISHFLSVFEKYKNKVIFSYLFGSLARGDYSPLSDIDIAVFLSKKKKESDFDIKLSLYNDFNKIFKRNDIDVLILNTTKNLILLDEIVRNGLVVYDTCPEIREEFEINILHEAIDFKQQRLLFIGI
ncbi:MAG: nucleotidyltransferase domain-containing protein [Desulfobacterales bacterium]|nr:nucleotidyltransferase domain-containing protein [Desulfobacterales bacterium]